MIAQGRADVEIGATLAQLATNAVVKPPQIAAWSQLSRPRRDIEASRVYCVGPRTEKSGSAPFTLRPDEQLGNRLLNATGAERGLKRSFSWHSHLESAKFS